MTEVILPKDFIVKHKNKSGCYPAFGLRIVYCLTTEILFCLSSCSHPCPCNSFYSAFLKTQFHTCYSTYLVFFAQPVCTIN
jgi:hypothetical protein